MEIGDGGDKLSDSGGGVAGEKRDIRRPMNAFLIFCKRHRSMVREKHPDRDNRSVTRILGDLWANLADEEKSVYTNLAKQYKDAFMKANPDYKWHSTERLPQPTKMSTRPTNIRPPRSLSTSDCAADTSADGERMVGLNLLLMADQQTARTKDTVMSHVLERRMTSPDLMGANSALLQLAEMCSSELHSRQTESSPVCSAPPKKRVRHWSYSEFGHSEMGGDSSSAPISSHVFPPIPNPALKSTTQPSATKTSEGQRSEGEEVAETEKSQNESLRRLKIAGMLTSDVRDFSALWAEARKTDMVQGQKTPVAEADSDGASSRVKSATASPSAGMGGMPPKKKFTKLQESFHNHYPIGDAPPTSIAMEPVSTATAPGGRAPATVTAGNGNGDNGCLSDQNDNAIFTCGKLVVDHIIDRLFSANLAPSKQSAVPCAPPPTSTDIERARQILTEDISERDRNPGPAHKHMGKLLSEVAQKPQNLVEKVIEEAYSMNLGQAAKKTANPDPTPGRLPKFTPCEKLEPGLSPLKSLTCEKIDLGPIHPKLVPCERLEPCPNTPQYAHCEKLEPKLEPIAEQQVVAKATETSENKMEAFGQSFNSLCPKPADISAQPAKLVSMVAMGTKEEVDDGYLDDMMMAELTKGEDADFPQDEDDGYSQPVRKSRRRNRGQRYQELINEGIIQPSKERLAARRHEQLPAVSHLMYEDERLPEESLGDGEFRPRFHLKRSISESDSNASDEKRYRTGDFDLEAEIATLPPCSLDQVSKRRQPRKISESEGGRKLGGTQAGSASPSQVKEESSIPEPPSSTGPTLTKQLSWEPLTGSQKRKARKHSINRLSADSNSKPQGIAASLPKVRDATISPIRQGNSATPKPSHAVPASASDRPAVSLTSPVTLTSSLTLTSTPSVSSSDADKTSRLEEGGPRAEARNFSVGERSSQIKVSSMDSRTGKVVVVDCTEEDSLKVKKKERSSSPRQQQKEAVAGGDGSAVAGSVMDGGLTNSAAASVLDSRLKDKLGMDSVSGCDSLSKGSNRAEALQGRELLTVNAKSVRISSQTFGHCGASDVVFNVADGLRSDPPSKLPAQRRDVTLDAASPMQESLVHAGTKDQELVSNTQSIVLETDLSVDPKNDSNSSSVFLSETSRLLCVDGQKDTEVRGKKRKLESAADEGVTGAKTVKRIAEVVTDSHKQMSSELLSSLSTGKSSVVRSQAKAEQFGAVGDFTPNADTSSLSSVAMETSALSDSSSAASSHGKRVFVTVTSAQLLSNSSDQVSPFASSADSSSVDACLTSVAVTAAPTTLGVEGMEEGSSMEGGMGAAVLCAASTLPGSPSVTAVQS